MTTTLSDEQVAGRKEYANGLREIADWIETTDADVTWLSPKTFDLFAYNKDTFDTLSSKLGGFREKVIEGSYAITRRRFGPHKVEVNIAREQVCKRIQVGEQVVPAKSAVEEHVEPVYEWQCNGFTVTT